MSLLKRIGKALRPLGGVAKAALSIVPGGSAILAARDAVRATRAVAKAQPIPRPSVPLYSSLTPRTAAAQPRITYLSRTQAAQAGFAPGLSSSLALGQSYGASPMSLIRLPAPRAPGRVVRRPRYGQQQQQGGVLGDIFGGGLGGIIGGGMAGGDSVTVTGRRYRPRAKGITGRELKAFSRVTRILDKYAKTKPPTKHAARRGRSTRCK